MKALQSLKQFLIKYKHSAILSYFFVYITWFLYLENTVTKKYHIMYTVLDDYIPFHEIFIIPYFLWFAYIAVTIVYFLFTSKQDYYKYCANLFIGMTICLLIYTIWPNGHNLRADLSTLGRSNIFTHLLSTVYTLDTATNVFPSIHVFNSVAAFIAVNKSESLKKYKWIKWSALLLTISICMSTVLLKQHSILDIFGGLSLNALMYLVVYVPSWKKVKLTKKERHEEFSNI